MTEMNGNPTNGNGAQPALSPENAQVIALTRKDFVSDQEVRWCPGCGDYSILAQTQKVMPDFGYPRENMEVTPDKTAIGIGADNIVFSIRFGETCLLGQWGNIGYTSLVTEVLSTGRCIVGTPRPA